MTFPTYLTLSTVAVGQPVLDLYGKNLTIFSAAKLNSLGAALFVLTVVAGPAVVAWSLARISRKFGPVVREATELLMVRLFLVLFVMALLNTWGVTDDFLVFGFALAGSYLIGRLFDRSTGFRAWFRWFQIAPVVVVAVFFMQAQPVFIATSAPLAKITVKNDDVSVLQIIFDEFPLFAVLDSSGNINAERFPGLATLQREGTWFRDSAAVSNFTHQAVPAILTSSIPSQASSPLLALHKKNVFTLLGSVMDVNGYEPVTSLCPKSVCAYAKSEKFGFSFSRLGNFLFDSLKVYQRRVAPERIAQHLPRIDTGWGGFGVVAQRFKNQSKQGFFVQQDNLINGAREVATSTGQRYELVHALMPHAPWYVTPDNRAVVTSRGWGAKNPPNGDASRDTYQRFLYQAVAADSALLDAINELKSSGRWDSTMVVFTADHGVTFEPGTEQRNTNLSDPDVIDDLYRVPTFIKYPGQTTGEVSDCAISNLDLLPTIVDVLGVETKWTFEGRSVANDCPVRDSRPIESASGQSSVLTGGFERTVTRQRFYDSMVPSDGDARSIAAVGESAALIGTQIASSPDVDTSVVWTSNHPQNFDVVSISRGSPIPAVVRGGVVLKTALPKGSEGILLVDGIAAGVIGEFGEGGTYFTYTSILDFELLTEGPHTLSLVLRDGKTGKITAVGPPTRS